MTPFELWTVAQTLSAAVAAIESYEDQADFAAKLRLRDLLAAMDAALDLVEFEERTSAREAEYGSR